MLFDYESNESNFYNFREKYNRNWYNRKRDHSLRNNLNIEVIESECKPKMSYFSNVARIHPPPTFTTESNLLKVYFRKNAPQKLDK